MAGASYIALATDGWADEPTVEVRFEVTRGLTAHARASGDGWIELSTSRTSQPQRLQAASDEEGRSRLDHGDYNFDGYQDLVSRASMGQVNEAVVVHLYDPQSGTFHELATPSGPAASCEGFWSLSADAANRTLVSTCRSGPMWYSDIYRYEGKRLYLYRSMRLAYLETTALERALSLEVAEDAGPPAVWTTFDPSGKALERAIRDGLTLPPPGALRGDEAVVAASRLPLYTDPGDATTKRYLVEGDRVELLDENEGWLQLRYRNPSRGPVLGWVKLPEPP